jgi:hypothetical protein
VIETVQRLLSSDGKAGMQVPVLAVLKLCEDMGMDHADVFFPPPRRIF